MAQLRLPRLPAHWETQPILFSRYWDTILTSLEQNIRITEGATLDLEGLNIAVADLNTTTSAMAISIATLETNTAILTATQPNNLFFASPDTISGAPTFRAIVPADIPTLNQNTTGTASYATTAGSAATATTAGSAITAGNVTGTVAIANGGTGATDAATARTNLGLGTAAVQDYQEGTWTPTITSSSGTITTKSGTGSYVRIGKLVTAIINITITTNGTGAGAVQATLPHTTRATSPSVYSGSGFRITAGFASTTILGTIVAGASTVNIGTYSATYPGADNIGLHLTIQYLLP